MRLLVSLARAVVKNGLKLLVDAVAFGGALIDIAQDAWTSYLQRDAQPQAANLGIELQKLAKSSAAQSRQEAATAAQRAAPGQPRVQTALTAYLMQVPAMIRRSLRRPSNPAGTTVPAGLALNMPADLVPFLPPKLPRSKPGDRPLPGVEWELVELLGVGGFGEVWKVRHPDYKRLVAALKFCLDTGAAATMRKRV